MSVIACGLQVSFTRRGFNHFFFKNIHCLSVKWKSASSCWVFPPIISVTPLLQHHKCKTDAYSYKMSHITIFTATFIILQPYCQYPSFLPFLRQLKQEVIPSWTLCISCFRTSCNTQLPMCLSHWINAAWNRETSSWEQVSVVVCALIPSEISSSQPKAALHSV